MQILKRFPDVILIDNTYKTNRYKMPLLNIVGITNLNTTFISGIAFLGGEEEADYLWALDAFASIAAEFNIQKPKVVVTDCDLANINALSTSTFFSSVKYMLCLWHIN